VGCQGCEEGKLFTENEVIVRDEKEEGLMVEEKLCNHNEDCDLIDIGLGLMNLMLLLNPKKPSQIG